MKFPLADKPIETHMEGIFLRPEFDYDAPEKGLFSDVARAKQIMDRGFCDKDGNRLQQPKRIGILQAQEILACFHATVLEQAGKTGPERKEKS